jgi:hypothetical protein
MHRHATATATATAAAVTATIMNNNDNNNKNSDHKIRCSNNDIINHIIHINSIDNNSDNNIVIDTSAAEALA